MLRSKLPLLAFFTCIGLLAFAYYTQYVWKIEPCPLCLIQRFFYFLLGVTFLGQAIWPSRVWAGLALFWSFSGILVAGRQIILQHLPPEQVPACGPGLHYMLSTFSTNEVFKALLKGSGECAAVGWQFLTFSFAEWSFGGFCVFLSYALWLLYKKYTKKS